MLCCAPEVMYAWKTHGLFERGAGRWRAKDLWDLYLLQTHLMLDDATLRPAMCCAFASRGMRFAAARRFFQDEWGRSYGSQRKWAKFHAAMSACGDIPTQLEAVKAAVADKLRHVMGDLGDAS